MKKPLIILTGPTAVGKTDTSIQLAKACNGEIISADSMQVYRKMDIGTAKIHPEEMCGIPHYMVDELEPDEEFNVYVFQEKAKQYIEDIYSRGKIPILVGGTGFYIQAVLYDIDFTEEQTDMTYRHLLEQELETQGKQYLHEKLQIVDPESADAIHENNVKRVIRALEYHHFTGEKFSVHNALQRQKTSPYDFIYIVLDMNRDTLYKRIDERVDLMMKQGLVAEVQALLDGGFHRDLVSMQGLGYKEIVAALTGECSMEDAVYTLKRDTRHFAKRQMTWFRREKEVTMLQKESFTSTEEIVEEIMKLAKEKRIRMNKENVYQSFGIQPEVVEFGEKILNDIKNRFAGIDEVAEINQLKVIYAMQKNRVSENHLWGTTGYGYNDSGRDTLERVYADIFHAEDALVRAQITCGTHALTIALSSILRPGDELLSPVGKPYDTLEGIIGMEGTNTKGSLREFGISYRQVDLIGDSEFDYEEIKNAINEKTKLVTIQRSKGYALRKTFSVQQIGELITFIKGIKPDVICMVDNCYGEFVQTIEPTDVGADICVGSLIKNPGGGLAPMGGYIVGRKDLVELAAYRLTAPGLGKEVGASLNVNSAFYQGLFLAPTVVASALKSAIFAANLYEALGFTASPGGKDERYDIIQAIAFGKADCVIAFCQGVQQAAPVDSYVLPEPYAMPGYHSDVIMAAGAFVQGSSIELSADAPIEPPYSVFFQGGITWPHGKLGILKTLQNMMDGGFVELP